ncbi:hypothetical protein ACFE04_005257 [Oxalis oulophora]
MSRDLVFASSTESGPMEMEYTVIIGEDSEIYLEEIPTQNDITIVEEGATDEDFVKEPICEKESIQVDYSTVTDDQEFAKGLLLDLEGSENNEKQNDNEVVADVNFAKELQLDLKGSENDEKQNDNEAADGDSDDESDWFRPFMRKD